MYARCMHQMFYSPSPFNSAHELNICLELLQNQQQLTEVSRKSEYQLNHRETVTENDPEHVLNDVSDFLLAKHTQKHMMRLDILLI